MGTGWHVLKSGELLELSFFFFFILGKLLFLEYKIGNLYRKSIAWELLTVMDSIIGKS